MEPPKNWDVNDCAGVSLDRRLELCMGQVVRPPPQGELKIWFVIGHARLASTYLRVGPIQFFPADLWPDAIRDGCPAIDTREFDRPTELEDEWSNLYFGDLPRPNTVLARVEIPHGPIAHARDRARDLLQGMIEAVGGNSGWLVLEGSAAYSEQTGWFGDMPIREPSSEDRFLRYGNPRDDPTGAQLAAFDPGFVQALVEGSGAAREAVEEVRWELAARESGPAQRLALRVRTLERALPVSRKAKLSLGDAAARHLQGAWSWERFAGQLTDLAFSIPYGRGSNEEIERLRSKLMNFGPQGRVRLSTENVASSVSQLADVVPAATVEGRLARELAQDLSSGDNALHRLKHWDSVFRTLLARSVRQRNAILHGAATVPAVIATCERFLAELTRLILGQRIIGAAQSTDLLARLEQVRGQCLARREKLADGLDPGRALFSAVDEVDGAPSTRDDGPGGD